MTVEKRIGEAAGKIWKTLSVKKALAQTEVAKVSGLPADLANQAIGWLAREGKVVEEVSAGRVLLRLKA